MSELTNPRLTGVVRLCISYALELAWFKSVVVSGKTRKTWSQARPCAVQLQYVGLCMRGVRGVKVWLRTYAAAPEHLVNV